MGRTVGWGLEVNVVDKLLELFEYYGTYYAGEKERSSDGLKERGRVEGVDERASDILNQKRAGEGGERWRSHGKRAVAELIPEKIAQYSGTIGGATRR